MNTRKLFGFAAIVAVIALSMTALSLTGCPTTDNGGNLKTLSGNITISGNSDVTVTTGTELTAAYDGDEEVTYQWYKDGKAIDGATTDKFTPSEAGTYTVTVSVEGYTSKTSEPIEVTGESLQDLSGEVTISPTANVTTGMKLTAAYSGAETVTYQWNKNGTAIENATEEEYTPSEAGNYTVTVKADGYKEKTSDAVTVISVFTTAPILTLEPDNGKITYTWTASDPAADSYDVYWKQGSDLDADALKTTGTKKTGAVSGGEITGLTNNVTYSVIVSANKAGYAGIDSDVETAIPSPPYYITGSGTAFTAKKGSSTGATVGTADQPIQDVIDAIRGDAAGKACIIHFGEEDGSDALDIGTASVSFANDGTNTWGLVELGGKITGSSTNTAVAGTSATIAIDGTVSVNSTAYIANTTTDANAKAIYNNSTGALTISGGTIQADVGIAVYNASTGKITVSGTETKITSANVTASSGTIIIANSGTDTAARLVIEGGTVENKNDTNSRAIRNASTGAVNITGGTVSATSGYAVYNNSTGAVTISGGTISATTSSTVYNTTGTVSISGGTVSATSGYAVNNYSTGAVTISGGTVSATSGRAVNNNSTGKITVSGTAKVTSANNIDTFGTIFIASSGTATAARLEISGGTIENTSTAANGNAIRNSSTGAITISGGTVSTSAASGKAIYNNTTGAVNITGGTVSATGESGYSIYNNSTGVVTVTSPPAVIVGITNPPNLLTP
jgi:hypothetical protein